MKPRQLVPFVLGLVALVGVSCGRSPAPETPPVESAAAVVPGSSLNAAFPRAEAPYRLTFTQEKDGYAQADLMRNDERVAQLSVSDTNANPSARDKFRSSAKVIGGHPAAAVGSQGTAILVNGRYQIQVRSQSNSFTAQDREAWLARFSTASLR